MVRNLLANYLRVAFIFMSQIKNQFEYISYNFITFKDDFCNVYLKSVCWSTNMKTKDKDKIRMAIMAYLFFEI